MISGSVPGKSKPATLAHAAAATVTADEPAGAQDLTRSEAHADAVVDRVELDQLSPAADLDTKLQRSVAEDALDVLLADQADRGGRTVTLQLRIGLVEQVAAQHQAGEMPDETWRHLHGTAIGGQSLGRVLAHKGLDLLQGVALHLGDGGQAGRGGRRLQRSAW